MSPAHRSRDHRWRMLVLVAVVVIGVAVVAGTRSTSAPVAPLAQPTALVSPSNAESSAWYCTGQTTSSGGAPGYILLTNTTDRAVAATVRQETDTGSVENAAVSVPARGDVIPNVPAPTGGSWLSSIVTVAGGGVAVTQAVVSPTGFSLSPCQSTSSAAWYFVGGSTAGSDGLYVSLLNPTSTPVVADLSFASASGAVVHPINFQGIVIQPDQVVAEDIGAEVQNVGSVSTQVIARTGRIVASEVQVFGGTSGGLSLLAGANLPQSSWFVPQSEETSGAVTSIDVYNPGDRPESVTVRLRLPSGPLAPFTHSVAPQATWSLPTNGQTRLPAGVVYSAEVNASGGPGVVVARSVAAASTATPPQAGVSIAFSGLSTSSSNGRWILAAPGTAAQLPAANAGFDGVALMNTSGAQEHVSATIVGPTKRTNLIAETLAPGATAEITGSALGAVGLNPILVQSTGTMAVSADVVPAGMVGVATILGIPMSADIGF